MTALPAPLMGISQDTPVLIAGPTGSGKSALAMALARAEGGVIVNADALQVYGGWRILTARPSIEDETNIPHVLYGHVSRSDTYSVGSWVREVSALLQRRERPIIVGGTGLYFTALTEGLAEIPEIPTEIREEAEALPLDAMLEALDPATIGKIDLANPARVRRAWEIQRATGIGMAEWHTKTPPPILPVEKTARLVIDAPKDQLTPRLEARFRTMIEVGAIAEVQSNLHDFDPSRPSDKAIGAAEIARHLSGEISLDTATDLSVIATRRYAKRQRTWFRARMAHWPSISMA